jgi:hypothetical protein
MMLNGNPASDLANFYSFVAPRCVRRDAAAKKVNCGVVEQIRGGSPHS